MQNNWELREGRNLRMQDWTGILCRRGAEVGLSGPSRVCGRGLEVSQTECEPYLSHSTQKLCFYLLYVKVSFKICWITRSWKPLSRAASTRTRHRARQCGVKRWRFWSQRSLGLSSSASSQHPSGLYFPCFRDLICDPSTHGEKHQKKFYRMEQKAPLGKGLTLKGGSVKSSPAQLFHWHLHS